MAENSSKTTISTKETAEKLIKSGILPDSTRFPDQSVKRLIRQGVLKSQPPRKEFPKEGYRIDLESVESYIQLGKLKPTELVQKVLKLQREVQILKGEIEGEHEQTELDEFLQDQASSEKTKAPKAPPNAGRFVTTPWKINNELPCPLCEKWLSASNFNRHAQQNHNITAEKMFKEHKEKADEMVNSKK